jgi:hypothetical protein
MALTGYDNTDQASGKPAAQVFLYDAEAEELRCASCNPTAARPLGASGLPTWSTPFEQRRYLSDSGERLFFESLDALDPNDVNGLRDVYEFELAGEGSCNAQSPTYQAAKDACLYLISSGKGTGGASFLDASANGEDAFISSRERLVLRDEDEHLDIYDARVGGQEPPFEPAPPGCESGEACRGPIPGTPPAIAPGSGYLKGPDDPAPVRSKPCPKGKRKVTKKGKARCVKPKPGHGKKPKAQKGKGH